MERNAIFRGDIFSLLLAFSSFSFAVLVALKVAALLAAFSSMFSFPCLCLLLRVFSSLSASSLSSSSSSSSVNFKRSSITPTPFRSYSWFSRDASSNVLFCPLSFVSSSFCLVNARPFPNPASAFTSFGEIENTLKRSRFNDVNDSDDEKTTRINTEVKQMHILLGRSLLFRVFLR